MHTKISQSTKRFLLLGTLVASSTLLGGCQSDMPMADDIYQPATAAERYPIQVAKVPMKLEVASNRNGLQPTQVNAIRNFARSAKLASSTSVSVQRPSGGGASAAIAHQVYEVLVENGVAASDISQGTYRGSSKSPVLVTFTRAVAVTKECGDWSQDLGNPDNQAYAGLGCAVQNNVAAMVSNPNDIKVPRAVDPAWSESRFSTKDLLK